MDFYQSVNSWLEYNGLRCKYRQTKHYLGKYTKLFIKEKLLFMNGEPVTK